MEKTIYKKGEHTVTVVACHKMINDKLYNFHIEGTDKYFIRQNTAIQSAHTMLLKLALSADDFKKRKEQECRLRHAHKIVYLNGCVKDTENYLKRWDGILYMETKKNLHEELRFKMREMCEKYQFKNAGQAIGFIEKIRINKKIRNEKNKSRTSGR